MRYAIIWTALVTLDAAAAEPPKIVAEGLKVPNAVCYGPNDKLYVLAIERAGANGKGRYGCKIYVIEDGKSKVFAEFSQSLNHTASMVYHRAQKAFYVIEGAQILKVDADGKVSVAITEDQFIPSKKWFWSIALDEPSGTLLLCDLGARESLSGACVYKIDLRTKKIELAVTDETVPGLQLPSGIAFDGATHFLFTDSNSGILYRVKLADRSVQKVAEGFKDADKITWDNYGHLYIQCKNNGIYAIPRPGAKSIKIYDETTRENYCICCLSADGKRLIVSQDGGKKLVSIPAAIPGWEVDESPLPVELTPAFANIKWTGWDDGSEVGKVIPLRPIVLTHANDNSHRNFVAIQQGTNHVFDNNDDAKQTKVFLDIQKKVRYNDNTNEEGLLGLAFHPNYKKNGEFFVFYTDANAKLTNVVSRFKVKAGDPNASDPASEEVLLRIEKPYWNHDGGTLAFGPDGCLYIVHGDGGLGNDPLGNGQNLKTHLGKILRINVDKKENGKNYSIPADNPFVKDKDALPEIYAYGLRNVWRMSFDKKTGRLWAADVGQNLYEEINLIQPGGNYGWSLREGYHPFGKKGSDVRKDLIEPIWEYNHEVGKSITGGHVYRGEQIPELDGTYLYADYVAQKLWALRYDFAKGRVTHNHPLAAPNLAVMSFGEDENGESYIMGATPNGRGIYRFVKAQSK